ncbi:ATP-binding protein [Maribacter chungangensis]|uniref:histidine kinase n=1 Tax=Maribacter chungangensis TaxID=1069117 RepID=A0ABW3B9G8_9FLAO
MQTPKTLSTLKILISYLLLGILALLASVFVYAEIRDYLSDNTEIRSEEKLLMINTLLTKLHEAESLSKLAVQSKKQKNFEDYALKIDSVRNTIDTIKRMTISPQQQHLLDSLKLLLNKKETNIEALLALKVTNNTSSTITNALQQLNDMEASLGIITPEALAPNIKSLSPKAQETIKKVANYLNDNVPNTDSNAQNAQKTDSILRLSKALLQGVKNESTLAAKSLATKENTINKTDIELSQQLRQILVSFEKEILKNSFNENIKKEAVLKRSIRLAGLAAVLGFMVVGIFIFILKKDFWKAKLYREKLEKEKHLSESLLSSRERLIRTVSHDVRTPINAIFGYTELLRTSKISQDQKKHLLQIKSAADYVNQLAQDLLDFSQLEAGKMKTENSTFNLGELIKKTAENIAISHSSKAITLILDIDDKLNRSISNDPLRIRQIITNILDNAYKFTLEGEIKTVVSLIQKSKSESKVRVQISDTGIGIPKEQQQRIFTEFTQADDKTGSTQEGYGLGLTISKKLTELLGGRLFLESTVGKGSTFTLELPILFDTETTTHTETKKLVPFEKPISILVIEDDNTLLQLIGKFLERANIHAIPLTNFDALERQTNLSYDLVLTDIEMPGATGYEVLQNLKSGNYSHYTDQVIIAMTGRQDLDTKELLQKGFSAVIKKPFTAKELLNVVYELYEHQHVPLKNHHIEIAHYQPYDKKLFSLERLASFLGNDTAAIQDVLRTFKNETLKNNMELIAARRQGNNKQLSVVAHRMLPMFRQMDIKSCIPFLELLEKLDADSTPDEINADRFKQLCLALEKLLIALENYEFTILPNHTV